jgi:hypothetical protein
MGRDENQRTSLAKKISLAKVDSHVSVPILNPSQGLGIDGQPCEGWTKFQGSDTNLRKGLLQGLCNDGQPCEGRPKIQSSDTNLPHSAGISIARDKG